MYKNLIRSALFSCVLIQSAMAKDEYCWYGRCYPTDLQCTIPCSSGCVDRMVCCPAYNDFVIHLQNTGAEDCRLTAYKMDGTLYKSELPLILPATGEQKIFTISEKSIPSATLTYECGTQKTITLYMRQTEKRKHKHTSIEAKTINTNGVFATYHHTVTPRHDCGNHTQQGKIYWQLTN